MKANFFSALLLPFLCLSILQAQDTLKVMQYNLLYYGDCSGVNVADKDRWLNNITSTYQPDIFTVNEMLDFIAYANRIKQFALTYGNMEYTEFTNTTGSNLVNMLFYNKDKLGYVGVKKIGNSLRDINVYTLYHKESAASGDTVFVDCIVAHLKAGSSSADQTQREVAARSVVNWIQAQGPDYHNYLMMGDFNIYTANEAAWFELVRNPTAQFLKDPTGKQNGWGANTPELLTQSPSTSRSDCGTSGGLDDRFDFILTSESILQGTQRIRYVPGSYQALGNDGRTSFNSSLNCVNNTSVPDAVCADLIRMSDHLPVVMEITVDNSTGLDRPIVGIPGVKLEMATMQGSELEIAILREKQEPLRIDLVNIQGQPIPLAQDFRDGNGVFPISHLAEGLYLLRISNQAGNMIFKKLVKK